ncbi:MAG: hypothetical protein F4Y02_06975 [Chloroflexi bacterium]|nr:hypothetical protein [Chloroflexota bacterium]
MPGSHTVRAEAAIERDGSNLLIKVDDAGFVHYSLPGGADGLGQARHGARRLRTPGMSRGARDLTLVR